jgi:thioesterase domain-containing protein
MAGCIEADQPFYAFQTLPGQDLQPTAGGIERMAGQYVDELKALRPEAPYLIGGYCFGALVALEMARILTRRGDKVAFLALIDSYAPSGPRPSSQGAIQGSWYGLLDRARRVRPLMAYLSHLPPGPRKQHLLGLVRSQLDEWRSLAGQNRSLRAGSYSLPGREDDEDWQFQPDSYMGPAVLFRPTREPFGFKKDPAMGWNRFIAGGLEIEHVRGYHRSLIFRPCHKLLAERLNYHLRKCQQAG